MLDILVLRGIIAVFLISAVSATVGSFSIFRGSTFFVSGIAHGALAGAALGIFIALTFFTVDYLVVALLFAILFALAIGYASHRNENVDVAVGIMFAVSMSLAVLFLSMIREYASVAWGLIIGDILLLSQADIEILVVSVTFIVLIFLIFFRKFLYVVFDSESAEASGLHVFRYETLLFILMAVGVVSLLKCVGAILVYALLIIPAAAARRAFPTVEGTIAGAFIIALVSGLFGIGMSFVVNVAPSSMAGLFAAGVYALTLFRK
ncbi:MAG: metal ABC transporter permease [Euryarchaeota archaeon]|nr:metal ABC transporter permease [Euryarchaeota archaeon]